VTKKHFDALALELAWVRPVKSGRYFGWRAAVEAVATVCQKSSLAFDRERFIDACEHWTVKIKDGELARVL